MADSFGGALGLPGCLGAGAGAVTVGSEARLVVLTRTPLASNVIDPKSAWNSLHNCNRLRAFLGSIFICYNNAVAEQNGAVSLSYAEDST